MKNRKKENEKKDIWHILKWNGYENGYLKNFFILCSV